MRDAWETVNNRWNQWVLNYSRGQQFDALKWLGFNAPSWEDLALLLIGIISSLALIGAVWAGWDHHRIEPWRRQMDRLQRRVRMLGLPAHPHDTPRTLAARLRERFGARAEPLVALLVDLEQQRYGHPARARPDATLTRRFSAAARELRPAAR